MCIRRRCRSVTRDHTRELNKKQTFCREVNCLVVFIVPFGVTYEKIGTIQRRLAWPLHKDDTLSRSGRPTGLNIYFSCSLFLLLVKSIPSNTFLTWYSHHVL